MNNEHSDKNRRILVIDDNPSIHEDFRKILVGSQDDNAELEAAEAELFGQGTGADNKQAFELTSAFQGQEGLAKLTAAMQSGHPFAMAFVDVRMPPGWDGIETITRLWKVDPDLQIVVCTAYSDYSWDEMVARLGMSDKLVILKKPFDTIEVQQLTNALTEKWNLMQQVQSKFKNLEQAIYQRTSELQTSNEQLRKEVQERQITEQALRATQEKLNHFLAKNPAVLFSLRLEAGNVIPAWVSDNFTQFTGKTIEQWYQQTPTLEYVEEMDRSTVKAGQEKLLLDGQVSLQYRVSVKGGQIKWVRDDRRLVLDAGGQPAEIAGCWTDITEQRKLEEQLSQAQKMESVGQLAGGVAHDFNNLLMVILGHVELLLNGGLLPDQTVESLQRIQTATERASNLTRQLLAFSRKQVMRPRALDINEIIGSITKLLERTIGEDIIVTTKSQSGLPAVLADRSMVEQIIMNLAVNARDAMPNGGQIVISTSAQEIDAAHQHKQPDSRPGRFVCLSVTDTGCGISEDVLSRIFEPFFTTKEVGKGTGLGLATVYGNVRQHNGWVEVESHVGRGTTFKVYLPSTVESVHTGDTTILRRTVRGGKETILVVEDEPALGGLIHVLLRRQGYTVHTTSSGAEALAVWAARMDEINLLLTDIVMPDGLNGWELARELLAIKPSLKVIYMSGYNTEMTSGKLVSEKDICFLEKPFGPQRLAGRIRDCLDGVASSEPESMLIAETNPA